MTGAFPGSLPSTIPRTETDMRGRLRAFLHALADSVKAGLDALTANLVRGLNWTEHDPSGEGP